MTVRTIRQILNGLTAACVLGIVGVAVWAMSSTSLPAAEVTSLGGPRQSDATTNTGDVSEQQLISVTNRKLQGPLKEPKIVQTKATTTKPRKPAPLNPRVELLATVIDPVRTVAIISDARGRTDVKGVGDVLELMPSGLRIDDIQPDEVTLSLRGRTISVKLKKGAVTGSRIPVDTNRNRKQNRNRRNRSTDDDD